MKNNDAVLKKYLTKDELVSLRAWQGNLRRVGEYDTTVARLCNELAAKDKVFNEFMSACTCNEKGELYCAHWDLEQAIKKVGQEAANNDE